MKESVLHENNHDNLAICYLPKIRRIKVYDKSGNEYQGYINLGINPEIPDHEIKEDGVHVHMKLHFSNENRGYLFDIEQLYNSINKENHLGNLLNTKICEINKGYCIEPLHSGFDYAYLNNHPTEEIYISTNDFKIDVLSGFDYLPIN
ncbi:MAG: hypothetical protein HRK26_00330 [Rickettsiaceae bacterium H1]|nr:hypothetical protein [Rickettsiaceae bacterium H1]